MNSKQEEKLKLLAGELAQDIRTGEDLSALCVLRTKMNTDFAPI